MIFDIVEFVRESNRIENIHRDPTQAEIDAHLTLLDSEMVTVEDLAQFVSAVQPGARLRDKVGLNVFIRSGDRIVHTPPAGAPKVKRTLQALLDKVPMKELTPFQVHQAYETLHPFTDGNGRSGRALWLWMMGDAPLGFLHHWYYQSLQEMRHGAAALR